MKVKYKKSKKLSRNLFNNSTLQETLNPQDKFENAKRELQKFSSEEEFHHKMKYGDQIRIDEWTSLTTQKQQVPSPPKKKVNKPYITIEEPQQAIINEMKRLRIKKQKTNLNNESANIDKKSKKSYSSSQRAHFSFRTIKPIDGNDTFRKTLRHSNEAKRDSIRKMVSKTPLQHRQKYQRQSTMNQTSTNKETFRLLPHEKHFIFGHKFNFISLDPNIIDQGIKKNPSKANQSSKKIKQKNLKNRKIGFLSEKISTQVQKTQNVSKIIDGHNFNQSQIFLKMGMLKPEISKLMQLIKKQDNNKIKFDMQFYRKKNKMVD